MKNIFFFLFIFFFSCNHQIRENKLYIKISKQVEECDKIRQLIVRNVNKLPVKNNASGYNSLYMNENQIIALSKDLSINDAKLLNKFVKENLIEGLYFHDSTLMSFEFKKTFHLLFHFDQIQIMYCKNTDKCIFTPSNLNSILKNIDFKNGWRYYKIRNKIGKPS